MVRACYQRSRDALPAGLLSDGPRKGRRISEPAGMEAGTRYASVLEVQGVALPDVRSLRMCSGVRLLIH